MEIELLAPVGGLEAFKSAIDNGANANGRSIWRRRSIFGRH